MRGIGKSGVGQQTIPLGFLWPQQGLEDWIAAVKTQVAGFSLKTNQDIQSPTVFQLSEFLVIITCSNGKLLNNYYYSKAANQDLSFV